MMMAGLFDLLVCFRWCVFYSRVYNFNLVIFFSFFFFCLTDFIAITNKSSPKKFSQKIMIVLVFGSRPVCKHQTIYKSTKTRRNIKKQKQTKSLTLSSRIGHTVWFACLSFISVYYERCIFILLLLNRTGDREKERQRLKERPRENHEIINSFAYQNVPANRQQNFFCSMKLRFKMRCQQPNFGKRTVYRRLLLLYFRVSTKSETEFDGMLLAKSQCSHTKRILVCL